MKRRFCRHIALVALTFSFVTDIACGSLYSGMRDWLMWGCHTLSTCAPRDGDGTSGAWYKKLLIGSAALAGLGWAYWKWKQRKAPNRAPRLPRRNPDLVVGSTIDFSLEPDTSPANVPGTTLHVQEALIKSELNKLLPPAEIPRLVMDYLKRQSQVLENCDAYVNFATDAYLITGERRQTTPRPVLHHVSSSTRAQMTLIWFATVSRDGKNLVSLYILNNRLVIQSILHSELTVETGRPYLSLGERTTIELPLPSAQRYTGIYRFFIGNAPIKQICFVGESEVAVLFPICDVTLVVWNIHTRQKIAEHSFGPAIESFYRQFYSDKTTLSVSIVDKHHLMCCFLMAGGKRHYAIIDEQGKAVVRFIMSGNEERLKMLDNNQVAIIDSDKKMIKIFKLSDDYVRIIDRQVIILDDYEDIGGQIISNLLIDVAPSGTAVIYPQCHDPNSYRYSEPYMVRMLGYDVR